MAKYWYASAGPADFAHYSAGSAGPADFAEGEFKDSSSFDSEYEESQADAAPAGAAEPAGAKAAAKKRCQGDPAPVNSDAQASDLIAGKRQKKQTGCRATCK